MPIYLFLWDDETIEHLAEHDVTPDEFEAIVQSLHSQRDTSRATGRPLAFGRASDGRILACVYEFVDPTTVLPVTAFEVE